MYQTGMIKFKRADGKRMWVATQVSNPNPRAGEVQMWGIKVNASTIFGETVRFEQTFYSRNGLSAAVNAWSNAATADGMHETRR